MPLVAQTLKWEERFVDSGVFRIFLRVGFKIFLNDFSAWMAVVADCFFTVVAVKKKKENSTVGNTINFQGQMILNESGNF